MAVPNTFAAATSAIPLANLDANFAYYDAAYSITGTAISFTGAVTLSTGTANGVPYLNASKVLTSGAVLTFDGTILSSTRFAGALNGTVGATTPTTGAFTTLSTTGAVTVTGGTANGVAYLNGSKVLTTGSALTFDGTTLKVQNNNTVSPVFQIQSYASVGTAIANITYDQGTDIYKLSNPSTYAGSGIEFGTGASSTTRYHIDTSGVHVWTVASEAMRLTSTGLGIGTSSPSRKFEVNGYARFTDGTVQTEIVNGGGVGYIGTNNNYPVAFQINAAEQMRLTSSGLEVKQSQLIGYSSYAGIGTNGLAVAGNVGIGTAAPGGYLSGTAKLVVLANTNGQHSVLVRNDNAGSSASSALALNASGNTWGIECGSSAKNSNALTFQLDYNGGNSTKMTLDSAGELTTANGKFNLITVGRGAGAIATNTAVGASALAANTTGNNNVGVGNQALQLNTTGTNNVMVGSVAGYNVSGTLNVGIGYQAVRNASGNHNVGIGGSALVATTSGGFNTAVGSDALASNTTASNNTAVGYQAGYLGTVAANSVVLGFQAGYTNLQGSSNTLLGYQAGYAMNPASAINTINTFVGYGAGYSVTTGTKNTILGSYNGNQGGLDIRTASNYIVLSDGDGNPQVNIPSTGALQYGPTNGRGSFPWFGVSSASQDLSVLFPNIGINGSYAINIQLQVITGSSASDTGSQIIHGVRSIAGTWTFSIVSTLGVTTTVASGSSNTLTLTFSGVGQYGRCVVNILTQN